MPLVKNASLKSRALTKTKQKFLNQMRKNCNLNPIVNLNSATVIFLKEQFYKNESLGFGKKIKNKLRTKPGFLPRKTYQMCLD